MRDESGEFECDENQESKALETSFPVPFAVAPRLNFHCAGAVVAADEQLAFVAT